MRQIPFKIGKTFTETFQMLQQAYGEDCLSRTQCHEWYQRFKSGRTSIEGDPKSGRPSTSMDDDHVEIVLAVIRQKKVRFLYGLPLYMFEINFTIDIEVEFFMSIRTDVSLIVFSKSPLILLKFVNFSREFCKKIAIFIIK